MKIAIDLDGVIANIDREIVFRLDKLGYKTDPKKWYKYNIKDNIPKEYHNDIDNWFDDETFYLNAIGYESMFYAMNQWFYDGNDIYIITCRPEYLTDATVRWLDEWCYPYNDIILGCKKREKINIIKDIGAKVLIEDDPEEAYVAHQNGILGILMEKPYTVDYEFAGKRPELVSDGYNVSNRLRANFQDFIYNSRSKW